LALFDKAFSSGAESSTWQATIPVRSLQCCQMWERRCWGRDNTVPSTAAGQGTACSAML